MTPCWNSCPVEQEVRPTWHMEELLNRGKIISIPKIKNKWLKYTQKSRKSQRKRQPVESKHHKTFQFYLQKKIKRDGNPYQHTNLFPIDISYASGHGIRDIFTGCYSTIIIILCNSSHYRFVFCPMNKVKQITHWPVILYRPLAFPITVRLVFLCSRFTIPYI